MFSKCSHLDKELITKAIEIIKNKKTYKYCDDSVCVKCDFVGELRSYEFQKHLLDYQHHLCVRIKQPIELYCSDCGDYQYNENFDIFIGKKRLISNQLNDNPTMKSPAKKICQSVGICNMGSTCFMGSVLQLIKHNVLIKRYFRDTFDIKCNKITDDKTKSSITLSENSISKSNTKTYQTTGCIACELRILFACSHLEDFTKSEATSPQKSAYSNPGIIIPSNLLYSVWSFADYLAGYEQQDAHEFLIALLNGYESHADAYHKEEVYRNVDAGVELEAGHLGAAGTGLVKELFSGTLRSDLLCGACGHRSSKYEPFLDLSLCISNGKEQTNANEDVTLNTCLQNFTSVEELSGHVFCDNCCRPQPTRKQLRIAVLPEILILHIKRFDPSRQVKRMTEVSFALTDLNLSPYTVGTSEQSPSQTESAVLWDLQGMVCHKGTLSKGHYTSFVRSYADADEGVEIEDKPLWLKCDDEAVSAVAEETVAQHLAEGYIFWYTSQKSLKHYKSNNN